MSKSIAQVVAIRREEHLWERRSPLTPDHVKELCQKGIKIMVQPSGRRIFTDDAYKEAGAEVQVDIVDAAVILGVKDIPQDLLLQDKTYVFYSHVNKGVQENLPTLRTCLKKNIRLIDYEELYEEDGLTTPNAVFSVFAGMAGCIDILNGLGMRLLALGYNTPFLNIAIAHNYRCTFQAVQTVREVGEEIAQGKIPKSIGPVIFAILGKGKCSQGVQEVLRQFPHEYIDMNDLPLISESGSMHKIWIVIVNTKDYLKRKDDGGFDREEYKNHPGLYVSKLSEDIAPYATVIINCLNWEHTCPVLMTKSDAKTLLTHDRDIKDDTQVLKQAKDLLTCNDSQEAIDGFKLQHRLVAICDIGAEHGAFEFITTYTCLDHPFFLYDAQEDRHHYDFNLPGVLVCSIDNMPTQFALEATEKFSTSLFPYIENIIISDATKPLDEQEFRPAVRRAVIASNGELTPEFAYLQEFLDSSTDS